LFLTVQTRKAQNISLQNAIVILDEAHNVVKSCEEAASFEISSVQLSACVAEIQRVGAYPPLSLSLSLSLSLFPHTVLARARTAF
jgi:Rad3-related DNA helicase